MYSAVMVVTHPDGPSIDHHESSLTIIDQQFSDSESLTINDLCLPSLVPSWLGIIDHESTSLPSTIIANQLINYSGILIINYLSDLTSWIHWFSNPHCPPLMSCRSRFRCISQPSLGTKLPATFAQGSAAAGGNRVGCWPLPLLSQLTGASNVLFVLGSTW